MGIPPTNAIILAAGKGERIGGPKALLELDGNTLLERTITQLSRLPINRIACVINQTVQDKIRDITSSVAPELPDLLTVVNKYPEKGPLHSIRIGLNALYDEASNVLILPVDFPFIKPATIRLLLDESTPGKILIPVFNDKRGHPPVFGSELIPQFWEAPLEKGARWIYQKFPGTIKHIETDDDGILQNVNTPEDWQKWKNQ